MPTVEVNHVVKSFADKVAVDDLSFSVAQGEMFGLIVKFKEVEYVIK